jgi:glycosyltransferase involved in cell wall biosynthesis
MKILFLHNQYIISGGEDVSTQSEIDLLKEHGHDVDVVYATNDDLKKSSSIKIAIDTIWSVGFYNKVKNLISKNNYDLIHVQNFLPIISPSVFYAAKKMGVKVVMSVRNYRLICPNALMYVNGHICDDCVGKTVPYPSISKKCYRESLPATAVVSSMLTLHNVLNTWNSKIDGYIAISDFVKGQLARGGINPDKIYVKYNFVKNPPAFVAKPAGEKQFLYLGRLSTEKGIDFLLEAFKSEELKNTVLNIIGDGPKADAVLQAAQINSNIRYLGKLPINKAYEILAQSWALIFPSQWHEPFGRTVVEAFSAGTPVIGASVGGVTELIKDNYNGFLYNSLDVKDLINQTIRMINCMNYEQIRLNARKSFEESFTAANNYEQMLNIYNKVLNT